MCLFCGVRCLRCLHWLSFVPCFDHGVVHVRHAAPVAFCVCFSYALCTHVVRCVRRASFAT